MTVDEIIEAIRSSSTDSYTLDQYVKLTLIGPDRKQWRFLRKPGLDDYVNVIDSIDAARLLLHTVFPGWIYRIAECSVSDDAWVVPDFNDPKHGQRFQELFPHDCQRDPLAWFDSDVDLRPSGRPAAALCISMLIAFQKTNDWLAEQPRPQDPSNEHITEE